ncbi:MAG TPA: hypothetical protein VN017_04055 [Pseudoxanthomonas sp.]|nr:hypothetical protein [Pseudoxanthomonas sp.]
MRRLTIPSGLRRLAAWLNSGVESPGTRMPTREEFVEHLWKEMINPLDQTSRLDNIIANCKRRPDDPFAEVGPAIERALAAGVSAEDICLILRSTTYEAVFGTLYAIGDPGVDDNDVFGLYELMATSPSAKW